ncbi:MAG: nucleotidyltransferase family protein [Lentihominibacter sp.]
MKTLGIIAEYNPFHNGHKYHMERAKKLAAADTCMVVMSGDFTQRGEPAISDKWQRAEYAVRYGANLVVELPFIFACNRAPVFARGGVDILVKAGADCIAFGCESTEPELLRDTAKALVAEEMTIAKRTGEIMKGGCSHAAAHEAAVREILGEDAADRIMTPNNILGVEYLKRMEFWRRRGVSIEDIPLPRKGAGYFGIENLGEKGFAGASEIRRLLAEGKPVSAYVPGITETENQERIKEEMFRILKGIVLRSTPRELKEIYSLGEGIENRIIREIRKAQGYDNLVDRLVSKRYTASAIRRILTYVVTGIKGQQADRLLEEDIHGVRLLAADAKGRALIRNTDSERIAFVPNINRLPEEHKWSREVLGLDAKAADFYNLLCGRSLYEESDYVRRPAIVM